MKKKKRNKIDFTKNNFIVSKGENFRRKNKTEREREKKHEKL